VLGLEAEKTFLSCFEAGLRILWGRGNLILLFCDEKKCTESSVCCKSDDFQHVVAAQSPFIPVAFAI
jgi:hypothetical protein